MFRNNDVSSISSRIYFISLTSVPEPVRLKVPGVKEAVGSKSVVMFRTLPVILLPPPCTQTPILNEYWVSPVKPTSVAAVVFVKFLEIEATLLDQGVVELILYP